VNFIDPFGLDTCDKAVVNTVNDVLGKVWASPMTVIGVVTGFTITSISLISGNGGFIKIQNNAITFTSGLNLGGSITFGNTIIHAGGSVIDWNAAATTPRYDQTANVNLGKHEEAHTYQYQKYGVFTPGLIVGSAIQNGGLITDHNLGKSTFETAADDYSELP